MNKFFYIGISIAITAFLATNLLLMFGDKSIVSKSVYVNEYERAYTNTYTEKLPKEALTAPLGSTKIYVQKSEAIDQWVVSEGDQVTAGGELAMLNEAESEDQRLIWESERDALESEKTEVQSSMRALESARSGQSSARSERASDSSTTTNEDGDTVELNVDLSVGVEVPQDGSYAAGIAQAEQQLAAIDSKLAVVNAQLNQSLSNPALISPVDGIVSAISGDSEPMSIEIYSNEKTFVTYVLEDEWQDVEAQDRVFVHAEGMEAAMPGTVLSISPIPAEDSRWLEAYRALDPREQTNPIAFYEVQIGTEQPIDAAMPYGSKANASIITNEAIDAVALNEPWIFDRYDTTGTTQALSPEGYGIKSPVTINFDVDGKAVLTDGIAAGTVLLKEDTLKNFNSPPAVFVPFPMERPDYEFAKNTNWRNYVEFLLAR